MGILTPSCRTAAVMVVSLPMVALFAGCLPSVRSLQGTALNAAPEASNTPLVVDEAIHRSEGLAAADPAAPGSAARNTITTNFNHSKDSENMTTSNAHVPSPGKVEHVGTSSFQQHVLEADVPVLVDFYADWCGPCRMLAPALDQLARDSHAKVVKVNIDKSPQLAEKYRVSSIPTLLVFKDGSIVAQHTGLADQKTLQRLIGS